MRIFVTGATGFLGSHFLAQAIRAGFEVTAFCRKDSRRNELSPFQVKWIESKRLDAICAEQIAGHDALVHLASYGVSPQACEWGKAFDVNVTQSIKLVNTALEAGVTRILACGSCFEYGLSGFEYDYIPVNAPLRPVGPYAASKAAFSTALGAMAGSTRASFLLIRPFHFYGEGQHQSNLWPALKKAASEGRDFEMTMGQQVRDFMPVEEVATAFIEALRQWSVRPSEISVRNLGSGKPVSILEFAQEWWARWGAVGKLKPGAIPYRDCEIMRFVPKI